MTNTAKSTPNYRTIRNLDLDAQSARGRYARPARDTFHAAWLALTPAQRAEYAAYARAR